MHQKTTSSISNIRDAVNNQPLTANTDSATSATATRSVSNSHHGDTTRYSACNTIGINDTKGGLAGTANTARANTPASNAHGNLRQEC